MGTTNILTKTVGCAYETISIAGVEALSTIGIGFIVVGCVLGVGTGVYFTIKHCNEMIDKFADFYKKNAIKISLSYSEAVKYLKENSEIKVKNI